MTILILGGTSQARELAQILHLQGADFITSLAGVTRSPGPLPGAVRSGGFGGEAAFRAYLGENGIRAIVDATHPFAARITERSHRVARAMGLAYCQILRPQWQPGAGDKWVMLTDEAEAADHVKAGQLVFLATGRQTLSRYANLSHARLICRQIDPPDGPFPFANGRFLVGRPPFSVAQEKNLFLELGVDWLVVKNAGGAASATKLSAARELGVPVLMIQRPRMPDCPRVTTAQAAADWLHTL